MAGLSPMMRQYVEIKQQHKDCLLFFRLGDFYEMFFDDAITASKELELTLTGRDCGLDEKAPMCGVPHHSVKNYIKPLIDKGYKIAICEQVEDPRLAKGIVKRDVVRIITPGTIIDDIDLNDKNARYISAVYKMNGKFGIAGADISTGEFFLTEITRDDVKENFNLLIDELARIKPRELLINGELEADGELINMIKSRFDPYITPGYQWSWDFEFAENRLKLQFKVKTLNGFGCQDYKYGVSAAGSLIEYLSKTQKNAMAHLNTIHTYAISEYMILDQSTRRNLEINETIMGRTLKGSLVWILDKTRTAMGGRMLRRWLQQPLQSREKIIERLDAVDEIKREIFLMDDIQESLDEIYDLERLAGRIAMGSANGRDLTALKNSLGKLPELKKYLSECKSELLQEFYENIDSLPELRNKIESSIKDDAPLTITEGGVIASGYNNTLDEYREAMENGRDWLRSFEDREREKTGIKKLKIGYNKVFGYYIDVTRSFQHLVPERYIRKQTLSNSERYITSELKDMEDIILGAKEKSIDLEYTLFIDIREKIGEKIDNIKQMAQLVAGLDVIWSFAKAAQENNYIKPEIGTTNNLSITNGRHPVVELTGNEPFVANNTDLDADTSRVMIITGPNMAGKSTYLRQVALITLMAHTGSFVPAAKASIPLTDRIFTRVGASDDLSRGQSTFMVEMSEVANILNNATSRSLLILDEIGRGTSTFDGLAIAWAVTEHIADVNTLGAKALFATHYHELTELEGRLPGVANYCIAVREQGENIIFLRKIIRGGADKSFGIQVAGLAGVPKPVIRRANELLMQLEQADINNLNENISRINDKSYGTDYESENKTGLIRMEQSAQLSIADINKLLTDTTPMAVSELKKLDVNSLTPLDAILKLNELKKMVEEKK